MVMVCVDSGISRVRSADAGDAEASASRRDAAIEIPLSTQTMIITRTGS